ncbi:BgTH12-01580 [Blumeria graminis f. sp. triticale]|uniref:BgTH12-01580 n=1 Tax=Blumeria graminis f. sp. triticale TaxID=1689686 RepID=A0A9W4CZA9_BLUGR|nr:BgTH12-01580 [Blumeria graminis f. sp. triticale]
MLLNDDPKKDDKSLLAGTMKFMALERLQFTVTYKMTIQCTYRHDLESFFYVFLLGCIEFEGEDDAAEVIELHKWSSNNIDLNYGTKLTYMTKFCRYILDMFSTSFFDLKDLVIKLRNILFGEAPPELGTPDHPNPMYEGMKAAFTNTIEQIRVKKNISKFELAAHVCSTLANKLSMY